jgi:hypothetical protein
MRSYYSASIGAFLAEASSSILGTLCANSEFAVELTQKSAWQDEIELLKMMLPPYAGRGRVYLEFVIPRVGKRADVILTIDGLVFVVEFKVNAGKYAAADLHQTIDYALDLKNFHETSHDKVIAPILVATAATTSRIHCTPTSRDDGVLKTQRVAPSDLGKAIEEVLQTIGNTEADASTWESGRYRPTPTIIEAARALYAGHRVADITRSDAGATNLTSTSQTVLRLIQVARAQHRKIICFVTGVPGAGKTLVGLNVATHHRDTTDPLHSVYLSGNGPLVSVLQEALARDQVARTNILSRSLSLGEARSRVKAFIQNVHHFRDDGVRDPKAPIEHVAIFDEAQRAWNREQTSKFMRQKRNQPNFDRSEPEFLIDCMDRHPDWALIVCLVGGGQEINSGEMGISGWIDAITTRFPHWHVAISPNLFDSEYGAGAALTQLASHGNVTQESCLHLGTSMRSFRSEHVSRFVKNLLDGEVDLARSTFHEFRERYPIMLCRHLPTAKRWVREQSRGSERYGIVASSQALRLKPLAVDVRVTTDPVHWFLKDRGDVRSSYYLEDVATEFDVQGLELDWTCVVWDGDLRKSPDGWGYSSFSGDSWKLIRKAERQRYLKNAYRVLLTRARQGMVIVVPRGSTRDRTRQPAIYDETFEYLKSLGLSELPVA